MGAPAGPPAGSLPTHLNVMQKNIPAYLKQEKKMADIFFKPSHEDLADERKKALKGTTEEEWCIMA